MKLKTKLTLSVSLLVLVVVLAVNVVYLAGIMREQLRAQADVADFVSREVMIEIRQEMDAANAAGRIDSRQPETLQDFFQSLQASPALSALFTSAIGYSGGPVRDVALVDPQGVIVADSDPLLEGTRQPQRTPFETLVTGSVSHDFRALIAGEGVYGTELPVVVGNVPLGTIRVGIDTVLLRQALGARVRSLFLSGVLIVLLATVLSLALSELLLSPLSAISAQLDELMPAGGEPLPANGAPPGAPAEPLTARRDEYGLVSSKIQRLGKQIEDVRQVYTTLQENVSQVLERLDEGLVLFDSQGQCVMASAAASRLLELAGREDGDLVGRSVEELFAGSGTLDRAIREAVRHATPLAPRELERRPGGRPLLVRLDPVPDKGGAPAALLTVRDAAPVHRLDSELVLARLTHGVAHEVKNPLNAMAIHLDLLREKAGAGENGLEPHINVIRHEIERLDRRVRLFLDFSRPAALRLVATDLSELAHAVGELVISPARARGLEVEVIAPRPGPIAWLDRDMIEQTVLNLVNNGLQAMEESGPSPEPAAPRLVRLEVFTEGRQAAMRIRDFGPGVAAEIRESIFDLFFTTRTNGNGIGLAQAARALHFHHGSIELEPMAAGERGASFLLRFPLRRVGGEAEA